MSHPILPFIPAVFVPVRDLKSATEWYAGLLERQIVPKESTDGIYIFDFGGTSLILDSNLWGNPPMAMFDTKDIHAAYRFCASHDHQTLTEVFSDEYVSVFTIDSAMICQAHMTGEEAATKPAHALLSRISHVLVHADHLERSTGWYERLVMRTADPDPGCGNLPCIAMDKGASLLIDDNRLCDAPRVFFGSLQSDRRVNPLAILETPRLETTLDRLLARGAAAPRGIESRAGANNFFVFYDPDGNGFMVREQRPE